MIPVTLGDRDLTCGNPAVKAGWVDVARQAWSLVTHVGSQESGLLEWGVCWGQDSVLPGAAPRASGLCFLGAVWIPGPLIFPAQEPLGLAIGTAPSVPPKTADDGGPGLVGGRG